MPERDVIGCQSDPGLEARDRNRGDPDSGPSHGSRRTRGGGGVTCHGSVLAASATAAKKGLADDVRSKPYAGIQPEPN